MNAGLVSVLVGFALTVPALEAIQYFYGVNLSRFWDAR